MKKEEIDELHEEFRDILQEVPEAEQAIRDYRALRGKQSMAAGKARMQERERKMREEAWDALSRQLRASGLGSDSIH